ncbi:hypothetical protein EYF80_007402 [Liparis tanakae]|uniref:Secreted protein n=1 Tax=Liparis tanakae TaxID=230148 RepID=A0A4Z2IYA4_9TELE|nr:hypothetical protein EYF80_007402 [Liparis tanakae]
MKLSINNLIAAWSAVVCCGSRALLTPKVGWRSQGQEKLQGSADGCRKPINLVTILAIFELTVWIHEYSGETSNGKSVEG